jgi:ATP-dependent DNA helicase PIF1
VDKTFFVDGLGGAGKTFLYGCLLSKVRSTSDIALSMASSGIVALLLEGGCTAHSRFKIPIVGLCGSFACYVPLNNPQAALIRAARLIVWDEAPMAHKHVFEAVNRTFQHVMGVVDPALKDILFGGKVVVMGGEFRQLLPMVPRGTRGQIVDASLKRSAILWHNVKVRHLHENMCVHRLLAQGGANVVVDAQQQQAWADYLQCIGEGTEQVFPEVGEEAVLIPEDMCC